MACGKLCQPFGPPPEACQRSQASGCGDARDGGPAAAEAAAAAAGAAGAPLMPTSVGGPAPTSARQGRSNQRYTDDGARLVAG